jgi:hypothetical protein
MAAIKPTRIVLAILLLLAAVSVRAEDNKCPWLNQATASGLLGGDAMITFTSATNGQPAVCAFEQKTPDGMRELTISVAIDADAQMKLDAMMHGCGAADHLLQAIGNAAGVCTMDTKHRQMSERIVGRVRDQIFTISFVTTLKNDSELNRDSMMSKSYSAAEEVAGNLF